MEKQNIFKWRNRSRTSIRWLERNAESIECHTYGTVFSALQFSYGHSLCLADGTFVAHLFRRILHFSDSCKWTTQLSDPVTHNQQQKKSSHPATVCLSKLLEGFKMPLHGFLESGGPPVDDAICIDFRVLLLWFNDERIYFVFSYGDCRVDSCVVIVIVAFCL